MVEQAHATPRRRRRPYILAALSITVVVLGALWYNCGLNGCPNVQRLKSYQPGGATLLFDAAGKQFADLSPVDHEVVALASLPAHVPGAFIAVEDHRFRQHNGIDYRRVGGALIANVQAMRYKEGFSTITMQLARNVFSDRLPGRKRTLRRKVLEMRVARDIERAYDKDEILELYLNHIYFGGGAYGIEAASRNYFGKAAVELSIAEAALLAALPKSPTLYNPRRYRERSHQRRDLVLGLMVKHGQIREEERARTVNTRVAVRREPPLRRSQPGVAPWFVEATRRVLEDRFGEDVYTAPLRVHTSLDRRAQEVAEQTLQHQLTAIEAGRFGSYEGTRYDAVILPEEGTDYIQGAIVLMDVQSGDVRALVGGRDFAHSRFDRATQARRQAGSAFKPFVYAAAMAEGYAPSQLVSDAALHLALPGGEVWEAHNDGGVVVGAVSIRDALVWSKNVPTIRLAADVGLNDIVRVARRSGIRSELPAVPSLAIGTVSVTALELTAAYTPLARLGSAVAPRLVTRVEDADGNVIWAPEIEPREVMDSAVAYLVTHMLQEAVQRGTGLTVRRTGYGGTVAGKTGATNDGSDVWFVGYTPKYAATIWIGFDRPHAIVSDANGGTLAAPVWALMMNSLAPNTDTWPIPSGVVTRAIDPASGAVLPDGCQPHRGRPRTELFIAGNEPVSVCPRGKPLHTKTGALRRAGGFFGRAISRINRFLTRHFGSEEPQAPPPEENYLGVPRLPKAQDTTVTQVQIDSLAPQIISDTMPQDTVPRPRRRN
jgi:penicillin-binding protein 1A